MCMRGQPRHTAVCGGGGGGGGCDGNRRFTKN